MHACVLSPCPARGMERKGKTCLLYVQATPVCWSMCCRVCVSTPRGYNARMTHPYGSLILTFPTLSLPIPPLQEQVQRVGAVPKEEREGRGQVLLAPF